MRWVLLVLLAGFAGAVQIAVNARLGKGLGHPGLGAVSSFGTGLVAVLAYCLVMRPTLPARADMRAVPWWAWTGGLCGALFVVSMITATPKLGAGATAGWTVAGTMLASVLLDHYGVLGLTRQPLGMWRIIGVTFVVAGVVLIKRA